ncbi:hypothetical protein FQA39_LY18183 [Lamprigera yunnana]|nr:hypothetical protein FQA39_LY18183 [Lamprigera yunnana]
MKMLKLLLSVACFKIVQGSISGLGIEDSSLKQCIKNVVRIDETILFVYNNTLDKILPDSLQNPYINIDVMRKRVSNSKSYRIYEDVVILHLQKLELITSYFNLLANNELWQSETVHKRKIFIILPLEEFNNIGDLFLALWSEKIINAVVLLHNVTAVNAPVMVVVSNPQERSHRCGNYFYYYNVSYCHETSTVSFPNVLRKYHDCTVHHIYNTVKEVLNISIIETRVNAEVVGEYQFLIHRHLLEDCLEAFCSVTFSKRDFVWVVPFGKKIAEWNILKRTFQETTWVSIMIAFLATSVAWWGISKFHTPFNVYSRFVTNIPSVVSLRFLLIAYIVYLIHIQTAFTSNLTQLLLLSPYESNIDTVEELIDSKFEIVVPLKIYNYFDRNARGNPLYNKIKTKLLSVPLEYYRTLVLTNATAFEDNAFVNTEEEFDAIIKHTKIKVKHFVDNSVVPTQYYSLTTNPGCYMLASIDKIITILLESGLIDYQMRCYGNYVRDYSYHWSVANSTRKEKIGITMKHLYPVFILWVIGIGISTFVFTLEIVVNLTPVKLCTDWGKNIEDTLALEEEDDVVEVDVQEDGARSVSDVMGIHSPIFDTPARMEVDNPQLLPPVTLATALPDTRPVQLAYFSLLAMNKLWQTETTHKRKVFVILPMEESRGIDGLFLTLWNEKIINVVLLLYNSTEVMAVVSNPQERSHRCGDDFGYYDISYCHEKSTISFPNVLRKYHDCTMHHIYMDPYDLERYHSESSFITLFVIDTIKKVLNIRIVQRRVDDRVDEYKFVVHKINMGDCIDGFCSVMVYKEDLVCTVPFGKKIAEWHTFKRIFRQITWVSIMIAFLVTSVAWWWISKFHTPFNIYSGFATNVPSIVSLRFLLIAYVIYLIHIQTAFTSNLTRLLLLPTYESSIGTLEELADSKIDIVVPVNIYNYFHNYKRGDPLYNKIKNKLRLLPMENYQTLVLTNATIFENNAFLDNFDEVIKQSKINVKQFVDNSVLTMPYYCLNTNPGSYMLASIDKIATILLESGLIDYQMKSYRNYVRNYKYHWNVANSTRKEKINITMKHLYPVYILWVIGMGIATFVFILEIVVNLTPVK